MLFSLQYIIMEKVTEDETTMMENAYRHCSHDVVVKRLVKREAAIERLEKEKSELEKQLENANSKIQALNFILGEFQTLLRKASRI